jgi:hypothetical protein
MTSFFRIGQMPSVDEEIATLSALHAGTSIVSARDGGHVVRAPGMLDAMFEDAK